MIAGNVARISYSFCFARVPKPVICRSSPVDLIAGDEAAIQCLLNLPNGELPRDSVVLEEIWIAPP